MEALYSKLYDKYTKLKAKKLSEFDQINKDQEVKFMKFMSAAEELIEHLKSENNQLHEQISGLRSEVASIRLAKDKEVSDYQRLVMEESKKNEVLIEEIGKFQKLHQDGNSGNLKQNNNKMREGDELHSISNTSSVRKTRKRTRHDALEEIDRSIPCGKAEDNSVAGDSATQNLCNETAIGELMCGSGASDQSGANLQERNWLVQALFEHVLGMKLSTDYQTGRVCISAIHQSSDMRCRQNGGIMCLPSIMDAVAVAQLYLSTMDAGMNATIYQVLFRRLKMEEMGDMSVHWC